MKLISTRIIQIIERKIKNLSTSPEENIEIYNLLKLIRTYFSLQFNSCIDDIIVDHTKKVLDLNSKLVNLEARIKSHEAREDSLKQELIRVKTDLNYMRLKSEKPVSTPDYSEKFPKKFPSYPPPDPSDYLEKSWKKTWNDEYPWGNGVYKK